MQHNHRFWVLGRSYLGAGHHSAIFKVFIESVTILFLFYVLVKIKHGRETCGILVPWPGIEPTPPALEGEVLTIGPPR